MKSLFCFIIVTLLISPIFAACPLVTDTVYTVAYKKYELDAGYGTTNTDTVLVNALGAVLRYGFLPHFDMAVAVPYTISNPSGLNDIYLHAKYRFWEESDAGLAARLDFKFKNGSAYQGLGSGDNDCRLLLIYTKKMGMTLTHLNFGFVNTGINAGRSEDDYFAYSGAIEQIILDGKAILFAEYVGNNALAPSPTFVLLGMRNDFMFGSKLDIGYAIGLNDNSIRNSISGELHFDF